MRRTAVLLFALGACASQQTPLDAAAQTMIRIEQGTKVAVAGVVAGSKATKAHCVAQDLQTEAERMRCVETALLAVRASKAAVAAVEAALVTFWTTYVILEARQQGGEPLTSQDYTELAKKAEVVVNAYKQVLRYVKEARP